MDRERGEKTMQNIRMWRNGTLEARRTMEEEKTLDARRMKRRVSQHRPKFKNIGHTDTRQSGLGANTA